MMAIVAARCQQPVLVVAAKTDHSSRGSLTKFENGIYAFPGVRSSIDIVTEKDDDTSGRDRIAELGEKIVERREISVDVTNCYRAHTR
jgi:hypothetical protein